MGLTSKATSLLLLAGSLSTVAAGSWPTSTSPTPTGPATSTGTTSYLAIITPCPWCPSSVAPPVQTISSQLQTVSTCSAATSACYKGKCHTSYPHSSWQWVSTTIPCSFSNSNNSAPTETGGSCLVTKTEDCVPVSKFTTILTSYASSPSSAPATTVSEGTLVTASSVPVYTYVEKDYCAVFSGLGPLAMLDHYDGSGLCTTCGVKGVGLTQAVTATDCRTGYGFASTSCITYTETWVSKSAPPATLTATQTWSSKFSTDGSWDISFTGIVPAQTISAPGGWVTSDPTPVPWAFHGSCSDGPTTIDFTTTVTTVFSVSIPWATQTDPHAGGWGDWTATGSSTTASSLSSTGADPSWSGWSITGSSITAYSSSSISADPSWSGWSTTGNSTGSTTPTSYSTTTPTTYSTTTLTTYSTNTPTTYSTTTPITYSTTTPITYSTTTPITYSTTTSTTYSTTTPTTYSTTTPTTSIGSSSLPSGYIEISFAATKYRKRDSKYIGFSGGDGIVVSAKADASTFVYDSGYLLSDGEYITCEGTGYSTFEKSSDKPASGDWSLVGGDSGSFTCGSDSFCESALGSIFIEYDSAPPFSCSQVLMALAPVAGSNSSSVPPTSTTGAPSVSSAPTPTNNTSSSTASTPTADPSSDPDSPASPAVTAVARVRRGLAKHKVHR